MRRTPKKESRSSCVFPSNEGIAGVGFEHHGLQVMSLASYLTALPRNLPGRNRTFALCLVMAALFQLSYVKRTSETEPQSGVLSALYCGRMCRSKTRKGNEVKGGEKPSYRLQRYPERESNPRPSPCKGAALPLSYPGKVPILFVDRPSSDSSKPTGPVGVFVMSVEANNTLRPQIPSELSACF